MNHSITRLFVLSAVSTVLTVTGCTTLKDVVGTDDTGMHQTQSTANHTAPVTSKNGVLVAASNHMTLYTFDKDTTNKSNCGAACLVAWPAFMAPSNAKPSGQFAAFKREDGKYQWAMNGKPLYFFANDTKPGDKNGAEKLGVWHVIPAN